MRRRPLLLACIAVASLFAGGGASVRGQASEPLLLDPAKAITQYQQDVWTTHDGLPVNTVKALAQTRDGYLWLGTQDGLVRFDGHAFTVFDKRNSALRSSIISALHEDAEGVLWIGTRGGGLARFRDGTFESFTPADGLPGEDVSAISSDARGDLWVASPVDGIVRYRRGTFTAYTKADGLPSNNVNTLYGDARGNLWIGTRDAGLVRHAVDHFTVYDTTAGLPDLDVTRLFADREGALWIGTRSGVARLEDGHFIHFNAAHGLPGRGVLAFAEDAAGSLWVGTDRGGLARFRDGRFETYTAAQGLSHNVVWSLLADREGGLWVGTQTGGLSRLRDGKFTSYTRREGLGHDVVYAVYEDAAGARWFGTEGGGLSRLVDGGFTTYTTADGLPSNNVIALAGGRGGSLWVGTIDAGLARWHNGRFETFAAVEGLPDLRIFSLYEDAEGTLWVGTYNSGLIRWRDGRFEALTTAEGLSSNAVTAIQPRREGGLWVGTYDGGINLLLDGRVAARYGTAEGLQSDFILSLYEDDEGALWIGTFGGGLSRLYKGELATVTMTEGLFNDKVLGIVEDAAGRLWMTCNRGLFYVSKKELAAVMVGRRSEVRSVVFDRRDGLRSDEFNGGSQPAGWRGKDGRLWFPSSTGVVVVDPARLRVNVEPPYVHVERVVAGRNLLIHPQGVVLAPGQDRIEFHYVGLSFTDPKGVRYRYRLEGVDEEWVEAGSRREAFYTNLKPGPYTFRVLAANADGVWAVEEAVVSFTLEPFFWQTRWFMLLCLLGVLGACLAAYRLRVRHLRARQRMLEALVDERTRDLREEKEKVERSKNVIEGQAAQLREMDRVKTRFFNNISHEFRTPLTLTIGPLENMLTGVYGPVEGEVRRQAEVMLRNARRLLRLINQLLDLSKLESGRMRLRLRQADLVALVEGVVLSFTAFADKNGIQLGFAAEIDDAPLFYDAEHLEKIFFNLLSNAVKFTPPGGQIDVTIAAEGTETVVVRVADTGPGIPASELPHIFDRFHQVDGTVSQVQEGTGIGLALVKELVTLHGGVIEVESEPGKGAVFCVRFLRGRTHLEAADLPHGDEAATAAAVTRGPMVEMAVFEDDEEPRAIPGLFSGDGLSGDGLSQAGEADVYLAASGGVGALEDDRPLILAVDDSPDLRAYITGCLRGSFRVATARNGREGLEVARRLAPDLIVSDVMMPVMDGYDFCRAVRADERLGSTPFVLLTAKASLEDKIEGLEAGADDYLPKPFNAEELFARVRNLLRLREQQQALAALNNGLKERNEALREASELKSQLLRIAAHDLKNPLNNIREFSKIVREQIDADAESGPLLDLIERASDQMLRLITQILESEALESGTLSVDRTPMSLGRLASVVVHQNRAQAARKGQTIRYRAPEDEAIRVLGSEEWLVEAMENLVSNAIKYSPPASLIEVSVASTAEAVRFAVRDEGPGLTPADREKLFRKFQRLSARPTGGETSTGLGLSIVKQIIELHEGRVWVESEPGRGATFVFELARHGAQASQTAAEPG